MLVKLTGFLTSEIKLHLIIAEKYTVEVTLSAYRDALKFRNVASRRVAHRMRLSFLYLLSPALIFYTVQPVLRLAPLLPYHPLRCGSYKIISPNKSSTRAFQVPLSARVSCIQVNQFSIEFFCAFAIYRYTNNLHNSLNTIVPRARASGGRKIIYSAPAVRMSHIISSSLTLFKK